MKKIVVVILTIICCVVMAGCSGNKDAAATKPVEDKKEFAVAGEKIELKKMDLVTNKVEVAIPATFNKMSADMLKVKYPNANPPQLVYTNDKGSINIAFSHTANAIKDEQLPQAKDSLKGTIKAAAKEWYGDGIAKVDGKNVAYLEFLSEAPDSKIYNYMMLVSVDNKLAIISFNCLEKDKQDWQPIVKEIMNSIKVK